MKEAINSNIKIWRLSVIFGFAFILFSIFLNIGIAFAGDITFTPQVGFGDEFPAGKPVTVTGSTLALFIKAIYKYAIGIVGIIAAVAMMAGGLIWLTAGGDSGRVNTAKDIIKSSMLGMVILFCSFVILSTVNPDLVKLQNLNITKVNEAKINNYGYGQSCCDPAKGPSQVPPDGVCQAGTLCDKQCLNLDGKTYVCKDTSQLTCCDYATYTIPTHYTCQVVGTDTCPGTDGIHSLRTSVKGKACTDVLTGRQCGGDLYIPKMGCCLDTCQSTNEDNCNKDNFKVGQSCSEFDKCKISAACCVCTVGSDTTCKDTLSYSKDCSCKLENGRCSELTYCTVPACKNKTDLDPCEYGLCWNKQCIGCTQKNSRCSKDAQCANAQGKCGNSEHGSCSGNLYGIKDGVCTY